MGFSLTHLLVLLIIAMVFFRPKKIPEMGQSIGKAIRNFKQAMNEIDVDAEEVKRTPLPSDEKSNEKISQTEKKHDHT